MYFKISVISLFDAFGAFGAADGGIDNDVHVLV
jgi:hypothetical protein